MYYVRKLHFENKFYLKFVFSVQYLILSGHMLFLWKPLCEAPVRVEGPQLVFYVAYFLYLLVLWPHFTAGFL
jgi:hypothetical protein